MYSKSGYSYSCISASFRLSFLLFPVWIKVKINRWQPLVNKTHSEMTIVLEPLIVTVSQLTHIPKLPFLRFFAAVYFFGGIKLTVTLILLASLVSQHSLNDRTWGQNMRIKRSNLYNVCNKVGKEERTNEQAKKNHSEQTVWDQKVSGTTFVTVLSSLWSGYPAKSFRVTSQQKKKKFSFDFIDMYECVCVRIL